MKTTTKTTRKKGTINQKTIYKTLLFFTELKNLVEANNGFLSSKNHVDLCNRRTQSWSTMSVAVNLGYIKRVKRGFYEMESLTNEQIKEVIKIRNKVTLRLLKLGEIKKISGATKVKTSKTSVAIEKVGKRKKNGYQMASNAKKFFILDSKGTIVGKTNGIRRASSIAMRKASKTLGKEYYIATIIKSVKMEYVPTIKNL